MINEYKPLTKENIDYGIIPSKDSIHPDDVLSAREGLKKEIIKKYNDGYYTELMYRELHDLIDKWFNLK